MNFLYNYLIISENVLAVMIAHQSHTSLQCIPDTRTNINTKTTKVQMH